MAIPLLLGMSSVSRAARRREGRWRGRTSRMRWRMKGILWVSREGGGEGDGVQSKFGLFSHSPAAKELGH